MAEQNNMQLMIGFRLSLNRITYLMHSNNMIYDRKFRFNTYNHPRHHNYINICKGGFDEIYIYIYCTLYMRPMCCDKTRDVNRLSQEIHLSECSSTYN